MANIQIILPFFFLLLPQLARVYSQDCPTSNCPGGGPPVRFPFRLRGIQSSRCGYPAEGFTLSCNSQSNQTTLALPGGNFTVRHFDYKTQTIWINDVSNFCLAEKLLLHTFTFDNTPFTVHGGVDNYAFLNCSSSQRTSLPDTANLINCLGGGEYTVYAVPSSSQNAAYAPAASPSSSSSNSSSQEFCSVIWSGSVPKAVAHEWGDVRSGFALTWSQPDCRGCEARGRNCGLDMKSQIVCTAREKNHVLPRAAKYGIIIGVGIPGFLLIIAIANYIYGKITTCGHHRQLSRLDDVSTSTAHPSAHVAVGLDAPTIESYPKILLGESGRLPRANDNTCSICLGEYQAKESLRTIPECNHYFHANCIDEWLKMNATCPVCRKSPEESSLDVTPSSSVSSSSTSLASL